MGTQNGHKRTSRSQPGPSELTVGERVDKRDAAQVGADKTPTKATEETNAAGDESRANERSSSERKKTRCTLLQRRRRALPLASLAAFDVGHLDAADRGRGSWRV